MGAYFLPILMISLCVCMCVGRKGERRFAPVNWGGKVLMPRDSDEGGEGLSSQDVSSLSCMLNQYVQQTELHTRFIANFVAATEYMDVK
ncbi:hypothetical protein BC937DRAFT_92255 [Endogone sp. FLAS-F59071]|nr:hypothetical protein BC937DRAFT_92255 [Endogone sp. FLAS-F59071]|eukprot:RUS15591.1 hypothetical protein BC937DRAFT_92255 [Endogone sp. FLAS-F59071]